jgi:hypothetical protein
MAVPFYSRAQHALASAPLGVAAAPCHGLRAEAVWPFPAECIHVVVTVLYVYRIHTFNWIVHFPTIALGTTVRAHPVPRMVEVSVWHQHDVGCLDEQHYTAHHRATNCPQLSDSKTTILVGNGCNHANCIVFNCLPAQATLLDVVERTMLWYFGNTIKQRYSDAVSRSRKIPQLFRAKSWISAKASSASGWHSRSHITSLWSPSCACRVGLSS